MVFSSPIFLFVFLPLTLICNLLIGLTKNIKCNNVCLLIFSIIFYAYGSLKFLPILLASILINYILSIFIDKSEDKRIRYILLIVAVSLNVALLFVYKYLNLFSGFILGKVNATNIILPIGISFYTFQVISYIVDVYRRDVRHSDSIIDFALFAMLFAQLIAGPIVRYKTIERELKCRTVTTDSFSYGIKRFMIGFAKKIIFANALGKVSDLAFANLNLHYLGKLLTALVVICYSIQIYLDFSAYSDMAIGIGKMLGFNFEENFNLPFIAKSITEFWKRWHISLSSFFRDYVYIPLGGSRKGIVRTCINLTIVFVLSGFWHGASFNFLFWGLYNALFIVVERLVSYKYEFYIPETLRVLYVFIVWNIGMILFRLESLSDIKLLFEGFVNGPSFNMWSREVLSAIYNPYFIIIFFISILYITPLFKNLHNYLYRLKYGFVVVDLVIVFLFVYAVVEMLTTGYNPFIYFRF